jgi:hypothetical protein
VSSSKRPKIFVSRSFISDAKSSGLFVLPGPPGNTRARCPMVKFGAVQRPAPSAGLGMFPGPRIVAPRDRVRVLDIRVLMLPTRDRM